MGMELGMWAVMESSEGLYVTECFSAGLSSMLVTSGDIFGKETMIGNMEKVSLW